MNAVALVLLGWLVPGGAYLLMRRYLQFAIFAVLVPVTFAAGIALDASYRWPMPAELQGLDGFTAFFFQAGAFVKWLAGGPFLIAQLFGASPSFLSGRMHEYGTTLLYLSGIFNLLAISNAFDLREAESR